ncbi:MAG TPA: hypothetical protein PK450_02090 [Paracoccaceae bacterium]|nr:hypothetical protein [Paracoccaceae bacterium]
MIAFVRLMVFAFVGLSILYLIVSIYSRSVRREKLEKRWDAEVHEGQGETERTAYIEEGMRAYEHGLKKRLIWLVYVIPMIAFAVIIYLVNWE